MWERNFTKWVGSRASVVVHTVFFIVIFSLPLFGYKPDTVLLVLTTVVSLEAIYLSIFIQMTVNQNTESLEEVEEDIEDIAEEVEEISENIDEIQEDVDEIQNDVVEIEKESGENLEEDEKLKNIEEVLRKLLGEVESLKRK